MLIKAIFISTLFATTTFATEYKMDPQIKPKKSELSSSAKETKSSGDKSQQHLAEMKSIRELALINQRLERNYEKLKSTRKKEDEKIDIDEIMANVQETISLIDQATNNVDKIQTKSPDGFDSNRTSFKALTNEEVNHFNPEPSNSSNQ